MAEEDPKSLIAPGVWAGAPLVILLLSLLLIPLGFLARLIDRQPATDLKADLALPRLLAFLTAGAGIGFAALTGYGFYVASEVSMLAVLAGLHPVAGAAPWLALAAGLLGVVTLVALIARRMADGPVRFGSLAGLFLTGASGLALLAFALAFDLGPL
jgi:Predicted ABC-type transport system involved in lysophospholipase L1 biosynthesis, permease component